jgi:hypothetical protein
VVPSASFTKRAAWIDRSGISLELRLDHVRLSVRPAREHEPAQQHQNGAQPEEDSLIVPHAPGNTLPEAARGTIGFSENRRRVLHASFALDTPTPRSTHARRQSRMLLPVLRRTSSASSV